MTDSLWYQQTGVIIIIIIIAALIEQAAQGLDVQACVPRDSSAASCQHAGGGNKSPGGRRRQITGGRTDGGDEAPLTAAEASDGALHSRLQTDRRGETGRKTGTAADAAGDGEEAAASVF